MQPQKMRYLLLQRKQVTKVKFLKAPSQKMTKQAKEQRKNLD